MHIEDGYANDIGEADQQIDTIHDPVSRNSDNWSWHFNRSQTGDSRDDHREEELKIARDQCADKMDHPSAAAQHLGYALHPDQDWVAHGDYNRSIDVPNINSLGEFLYYIHNYGASGSGATGWPDDPHMDADGSADGRATMAAMNGPNGGHKRLVGSNDTVYWVSYTTVGLNSRRFIMTRDRTKNILYGFQKHVKTQKNACKCRCAFIEGQ